MNDKIYYYTVYKITNMINNKIYVGIHKTSNLEDDYMGSGKMIQRAIEKYGIENFEKEYLAIFDNSDDMFEMETDIVNESFLDRDDTYNLKLGGEGGFDYLNQESEWRIQKNRNAMMIANENGASEKAVDRKKWLRENDPEWVKKCNKNNSLGQYRRYANGGINPRKGKTLSDETKKLIGEKNSIIQTGKGNSQYGTCWIYNEVLKQNKKIKKEELEDWLAKGWSKGRKIKF